MIELAAFQENIFMWSHVKNIKWDILSSVNDTRAPFY